MRDKRFFFFKSLRNKSLALFDVFLEVRQAGCKEFLFLSRDLPNGEDLLDTVQLSKDIDQRNEVTQQ
jgi:hypothetical protein